MNTLVIHPKDPSTSFLDVIYRDIPDVEVVTGGLMRRDIIDMMRSADRVMMMGHGSPSGLFAVGQFPERRAFVIDEGMVDVLREKQDNVFIWCYASDFVRRHGLHGFSTGMFISEVAEAAWVLPPTASRRVTQGMVDESNMCFVNEFASAAAGRLSDEAYRLVAEGLYREMALTNVVADYNYKQLRSFTKKQRETDRVWSMDDQGSY